MGQRLVMNIYPSQGAEPIMNVYYHWSAYTSAALYEALKFVVNYQDTGCPVTDSLRALEAAGARIVENDVNFAINELNYEPMRDNVDRSNGLIAISEHERLDNETYAEGLSHVYLQEQTFVNDCCMWFDDFDELVEWYEIEEDELDNFKDEILDIPTMGNLTELFFSEMEDAMAQMHNLVSSGHFKYRMEDGTIVSMVE